MNTYEFHGEIAFRGGTLPDAATMTLPPRLAAEPVEQFHVRLEGLMVHDDDNRADEFELQLHVDMGDDDYWLRTNLPLPDWDIDVAVNFPLVVPPGPFTISLWLDDEFIMHGDYESL